MSQIKGNSARSQEDSWIFNSVKALKAASTERFWRTLCVCVYMLCVNDSRTVDDLHADAVGVMNQLARIIQQPGFGLTRLASSLITRNQY